ncbi:MAG: hypothetical protein LBC97_00635, partial [Bifidobacteriaceae bacterium]|jgi:hypothetical protein|nr:hypothetical protein [Bifidobacteriaceae bacterium]
VFIGANIDAIATARSYGISPAMAAPYVADGAGSAVAYEAVAAAVSTKRRTGSVGRAWAAGLDSDVAARRPERAARR